MVNCVWMVVIRGACLSRISYVSARRYLTLLVDPIPVILYRSYSTGTDTHSGFWVLAAMGAIVGRSGIGDPKGAKSEHLVTNECTPDKLKRHTHLRQIVVQE